MVEYVDGFGEAPPLAPAEPAAARTALDATYELLDSRPATEIWL